MLHNVLIDLSLLNCFSQVAFLSAALPSVSSFFTNYIITITLSGIPYKLIRRLRACQYLFYRCTHFPSQMTRRSLRNGPFRDTRVEYGTELSDVLYVLCVVLLYWIIAPVVLLFSVPLFWGWYYTWKYQYVFVVTRNFESGGVMWYRLYRYSMLGLSASTIAFMTYTGLKEGMSQGPLLFPLPILVILGWYHTNRCFRDRSRSMPFDLVIKNDASVYSSAESSEKLKVFSPNFMLQPNMVDPPDVFPYPYRVGDIPLLDENGAFSEVYVDDLDAPVNLNACDA
jgi:hypothetical protein